MPPFLHAIGVAGSNMDLIDFMHRELGKEEAIGCFMLGKLEEHRVQPTESCHPWICSMPCPAQSIGYLRVA